MSPLLLAARAVKRALARSVRYLKLPRSARRERRTDLAGLPPTDPGPERVIVEGVAWLGRAQDFSSTRDGGVARHYSLLSGWAPSYPETTGYIIPTLLDFARWRGGAEGEGARRRARRMLDWLVAIQLPGGGFQGGTVGAKPVVPVTFNTGQILLGLAAGVREFGESYLPAMHRAASWLVQTQGPDGCWRKHPSPFAALGEKAYDTHVAWGLLEAARAAREPRYQAAALKNVRWALARQLPNGWFDDCCLEDRARPMTHALGYVLRGVVEAHRCTGDADLLAAARRTADGLLTALAGDGRLPGRLDRAWGSDTPWVCLTGSAQIALCWLLLAQATGDERYREAGFLVNRFVRRSVRLEGALEVRGGVKGSFPVHGDYGPYEYLNWACKFTIDANLLELAIKEGPAGNHYRRPPETW
jgi:hypothetical protein